MKVIIVDDEPLARDRMQSLLRQEPDIEIVGEYPNGEEALGGIAAHAPDVVFLDIQMPGMDGFKVVNSLPVERRPLVIFATAYDVHAIRAFEVHALDYLLKPYKQERFRETVQRARAAIAERRQGEINDRLSRWLEKRESPKGVRRIAVRTNERTVFVKTEDIDWVEAAGNYTVLHCGRENHVLRASLGSLEETLPEDRFFRVSRSAIVNGERVKELLPVSEGMQVLVLTNGARVPMTRGIREIQEILKFL